MRVILLFLDGVGIGTRNPRANPFLTARIPVLRSLLGGGVPSSSLKRFDSTNVSLVPANATLGVSGLPQSGTGQTAIFTGANGAKLFGRHFGPFPPTILRSIIESDNIFRRLKSVGKSVSFANAFPQRFFEYTNSGTRRVTVTVLASLMSGVPLRTSKELLHNEALSADFTRVRWPELGHPDVKPVTPREAGRHLWHIAQQYDFTLFEYWLTDHAGHSQSMKLSVDALESYDVFLGGLLEEFRSQESLVVMISDHGNIENLLKKTHTRNPVPCIAVGKRAKEFTSSVRNLTHITPAILKLF